MKLYINTKFLLDLSSEDGGYLLRQLKKSKCRVRVSNNTITLQNQAALDVAKKELWELNNL